MTNQILILKEKIGEKSRLENVLSKIKSDLAKAVSYQKILEKKVEKEFKDVKRIEGNGITSLLYSFLGNKVEKLDKERQEFVSARLKLDNCTNEIRSYNFEIEKLASEISAIGEPYEEYNTLLETRKEILKSEHDSKLVEMENKVAFLYARKNELKDAIFAGERTLQELNKAIDSLRNAKGWGTFDMIGGGFIATAVKHSRIDDAQKNIQKVHFQLKKFKRELADITLQNNPEINLSMDSFASFADMFFDNIITDWIVQSKINNSLSGCTNLSEKVNSTLSHLKKMDKEISKEYLFLKNEMDIYLENQT